MRLRQDGHEELQVHGPKGEHHPNVLPSCAVRHATNRLGHVFKTSQTLESLENLLRQQMQASLLRTKQVRDVMPSATCIAVLQLT